MSIYYRYNEYYITVMGQTYPHRVIIKSFGGTFVKDRKIWQLPFSSENLKNIDTFCQAKGGGSVEGSLQKQSTTEPEHSQIDTEKIIKDLIPKQPSFQTIHLHQLVESISFDINQRYKTPIWVIGEIEDLSSKSYGYYLTLSEKNPDNPKQTISINATLWNHQYKTIEKKHTNSILNEIFREGMSVCFLAKIKLYKGRSHLSLDIEDLNPEYSYGALALAKQKVLQRLKKENRLSANKKIDLSPYPFSIGLICAQNSRAYSDFCHQLLSGKFPGNIIFAPAKVQGNKVSQEIKAALLYLCKKNCDLIIITRGGGSRSDLRSFDEYELAKMVSETKIPIISAIGHHDDHCVLEEVSYSYVKTPTAAADFILERFHTGKENIKNNYQKIQEILAQQFKKTNEHLEKKQVTFHMITQNIISKIKEKKALLAKDLCQKAILYNEKQKTLCHVYNNSFTKNTNEALNTYHNRYQKNAESIKQIIYQKKHQISLEFKNLQNSLKILDPKPWINNGWTQLIKNKKKITSYKNLEKGDQVESIIKDGNIKLQVIDIKRRV